MSSKLDINQLKIYIQSLNIKGNRHGENNT